MITELSKSYPTARKEHICMWCGEKIKAGQKYERSTNVCEGDIYDWVCHLECREVACILDMFDNDDGYGINGDNFQEYIQQWLYDNHFNDETDTYDEGWDIDKLSYYDIVLKILEEKKED